MKTYIALSFTVAFVLLASCVPAKAQGSEPLVCKISITDPKPGTSVGATGITKGAAQIPSTSHLWVLAHKRTLNGWWPQGGGETTISNGQWGEIEVTYGVDQDRGDFEIAVVAVGDVANEELNRWVDEAPGKNYPPMRFPATTEGCPIARVTVSKQ